MASIPGSQNACGNRLLDLLPDAEFAQIQSQLEKISLPIKFLFYERNQPIQYVYFPTTAVGSALALLENGTAVESGTIGNEGMIGLEIFLGGKTGLVENLCQIPGETFRMHAGAFRAATLGETALRYLVQRYSLAYIALAAQSVACNRFHSVEERCARWLLMTHDRVRSDQFMLTQEFLADMLGVHRPSVSLVAGIFQRAGFITYKRGMITVLDRPGLESTTCECYAIVKNQFERLLGPEAERDIARMEK